MKRKISLLSLLLVCCFLFLTISPATGIASAWPDITPAYWDNIEDSLDAYFKMLDEIAPTQQNYPDSYGGAYIDRDGRLHIQIIESAKDAADYVPDAAVVGYVKYSLNELRSTLDALSNTHQANQTLFGTNEVTGLGIDEELNCIFVELVKTEKPIDQISEQQIARAYGGSDLIRFTYTDWYSEDAIAPGNPAITSLGTGTVGFPAENYFTGEKGFVTAAHIVTEGSYIVTVNGITGTVSQRQLGGSIDACFVSVPNAINYLTSDFNMDGNIGKLIAANQYDYPQNTVVEKLGNKTRFKQGVITSVTHVSTSKDGPTLSPLYQIDFGPNGAIKGDSGGPVFVPLGGPVKILIGIHVRNKDNRFSSTCKYVHIRDAFAVNLYVD